MLCCTWQVLLRSLRGGGEWQHASTGRPHGRPAQAGTRAGCPNPSGDANERRRSRATRTARPATMRRFRCKDRQCDRARM